MPNFERVKLVLFVSGVLAGAVVSAQALESEGAAYRNSFYAHGEDGSAVANAGVCYTTNSAVEATRGIRHWHACR